MDLEYADIELLRASHPGWRLLCSPHAPLLITFLNRTFIKPNIRTMGARTLASLLEDQLYALRERGYDYPRSATEYIEEWASDEKAFLRKFYEHGLDEPQLDLTPPTEKAISWVVSLATREFVGTESRLLTIFELLKQMGEGTETDPATRYEELKRRKDEIEAQIQLVLAGEPPMLSDTELRDRFLQFMQMARDLLSDFREVEHNLRSLDRQVRERIALWAGSKGDLIGEIMGERDAIARSDQGRSFRAFWDFLMSSQRQEQMTERLRKVMALPAIDQLKPDARLRRIHYDWLEAGDRTQRMIAQLSQQLRRFLDDRVWLENRRIIDIIRNIEAKTVEIRNEPPQGTIMTVAQPTVEIELPLERPLHTPAAKPVYAAVDLQEGDGQTMDVSALYNQVYVDQARLARQVEDVLGERSQVTLREVVERHPLRHGLAELVGYLQLGAARPQTVVDEDAIDPITWRVAQEDGTQITRIARAQRIIYVRQEA